MENQELFAKQQEFCPIVEACKLNGHTAIAVSDEINTSNPAYHYDPSNEFVSLARHYAMESKIVEAIQEGLQTGFGGLSQGQCVTGLMMAEQAIGFALGVQQKKALITAAKSNGIGVISGYAGTGKSTVAKALILMLKDRLKISSYDVVGCALSGVAANRVKQQTQHNAYTIHSLLGYENKKFKFNSENKLKHKLIILDESGMVDTWLFYSLICAIDFETTKLVLLGDPAQLPPIGPGQPFKDIIEMGVVQHIELTEIYRQSGDAAIPLIAESIRNGITPNIKPNYADVSFVGVQHPYGEKDRSKSNKEILEQICTLASKHRWSKSLPYSDTELWEYITHFQVITPRKLGPLGQAELVKALRPIMLPHSNSAVMFRNTQAITVMDKIVHLRNADMKTDTGAEQRIFNGQLGVVVQVNRAANTIKVRYPMNDVNVIYTENDIRNGLAGLAWALTIHKTQGAEFNNVVVPLTMSHFNQLDCKLLYTAVTRAKKSLFLIGDCAALNYASTNKGVQRKTVINSLKNTG